MSVPPQKTAASWQTGPFMIPAFKPFVPRRIQPWIYLYIAFTFQLTGGRYLGSLSEMMGEEALMREELQMCLYASLAGMALWFPMLFRTKFRFTNKSLLLFSCWMMVICNLATAYISFPPLLWAICFLVGICKIQGTFECLSNIQLWISSKRDYAVFFPILFVIILLALQISDALATYFLHLGDWRLMHYLIMGLMMINLLLLHGCTRHFRFMRKLPLYGIDWAGMGLWGALFLQLAFICVYGEYYDWWNSRLITFLTFTFILTLLFLIGRMRTVRHPYVSPAIWRFRHVKPIILLVVVVEGLLGAEFVLEETFIAEGLHYAEISTLHFNLYVSIGVVIGALIALWWLKVMRWGYTRLVVLGCVALIAYLGGIYFLISPHITREMLAFPLICRGMATSIMSITFLSAFRDSVPFPLFFQALCVFQGIHLVVGGLIGSAIYGRGLSVLMADNLARYGFYLDDLSLSSYNVSDYGVIIGHLAENCLLISIKQIYGWILYVAVGLTLLFLLYDAPARRHPGRMPDWRNVGRRISVRVKRSLISDRMRK